MEKKKFEAPVLKIVNFECHDVIAASPVTPTDPSDFDLYDKGSGHRVKGIGAIANQGKVSWD